MRPRKRFGQHFLEPVWVAKLVDAIQPASSQAFIEIGPGRGALTLPLAERAQSVVAVEIDTDLAALLTRQAPSNVRVVPGDFLDVDIRSLLEPADGLPARVVGNLPYNICSPILFKLLRAAEEGQVLSDAALMVQKEVADRLTARPGTSEYGVLAVLVQLRSDISRLLILPPGAFRPIPRVSSALVRLQFRPPRVHLVDPARFDALVRSLFQRRRKTLLNALKPFAAAAGRPAGEALAKVGLDPGRRPETLDVVELARLAELFSSSSGPGVL